MRTKFCLQCPAGKKLLGRSRGKWEDTAVDLRELEVKGVDWIHVAQERD
jgi:hypothetical protein